MLNKLFYSDSLWMFTRLLTKARKRLMIWWGDLKQK